VDVEAGVSPGENTLGPLRVEKFPAEKEAASRAKTSACRAEANEGGD